MQWLQNLLVEGRLWNQEDSVLVVYDVINYLVPIILSLYIQQIARKLFVVCMNSLLRYFYLAQPRRFLGILWEWVAEARTQKFHFHQWKVNKAMLLEALGIDDFSIGNYFLAAAQGFFRSLPSAIFLFSSITNSQANILPVIVTNHTVCMGLVFFYH